MADMDESSSSGGGVSAVGIVGMGLGAYASWTLHGSVGWAAVHGFFGWWYLLYLCVGCGGGLPAEVF